MKKRVFGRKLSRGQGARRALFRSQIRALVAHGRIVTTKTKAKIVQRQIERLVSLAKKEGLSKRRQVYAFLGNDRKTTDNLFKEVVPAFKDRVGGYTRIINLPRRRGDAAEMARLEWVKEIGLRIKDKSDESKKKKADKTEDKAIKARGKRLIEKVKKRK